MYRSSLIVLIILALQPGAVARANDQARPRVCYLNSMDETVFLLNRAPNAPKIGEEWAGEVITFEEADQKREENRKRYEDCLKSVPDDQSYTCRGPVIQPARSIRPVEADLVHALPAGAAWCELRDTFTEVVDGVTYDAVRPGFDLVRGAYQMSDAFKARYGNRWADGTVPTPEFRAYRSEDGWPEWMVSPNGSVVFSVGVRGGWLTAYGFRYDTDSCGAMTWPPCRAGVDPEYEKQLAAIEVAENIPERVCYLNWTDKTVHLLISFDEDAQIGRTNRYSEPVKSVAELQLEKDARQIEIETCLAGIPENGHSKASCLGPAISQDASLIAYEGKYSGQIPAKTAVCEKPEFSLTHSPSVKCGLDKIRALGKGSDQFSQKYGEGWYFGRAEGCANASIDLENIALNQFPGAGNAVSVDWLTPDNSLVFTLRDPLTEFDAVLVETEPKADRPTFEISNVASDNEMAAISRAEREFDLLNQD